MHDAALDTIVTVESHYIEPHRMAVYLVAEEERAAFVDVANSHAVPYLLAALKEEGFTPGQVEYIIVTHVHLDHAGGTAELLKHCPNATVLAHPKAARHLVTPERLIAGSKAVYGEIAFAELYGHIEGIPESRVRAMADGETLQWGARTLKFVHTLGHASHHMVIHDSHSNCVFAGDAFGIGRHEALRPGPPFMIASATPPEFDGPSQRKAIADILALGAAHAAIAHYGIVDDLPGRAEQLLRSLDGFEAVQRQAADSGLPSEVLHPWCAERVSEMMREHVASCGVLDLESDMAWLAGDAALNAMGVAIAAQRDRKKREG